MNVHDVNRIDRDRRAIKPCEPRLALSASLAGEMLFEAFGMSALGVAPVPEPLPIQPLNLDSPTVGSGLAGSDVSSGAAAPVPNLFEQAALLRGAWGLDGRGQSVAVIDSGVAWDHLALGGGFGPGYRVVGGWDFAEQDADPYDDGPAGFHGTHVAGALAGESAGFAGIAPGADVVALRVFDDAGAGRLTWIESALQWVHEHRESFASPITTVNLSVGAALNSENYAEATAMLEDELRLLRDDGILVFAASGNLQQGGSFTSGAVLYPAASDSVVAVASLDDSGALSRFAQREGGIFAARGESISGSVPEHVYGWDGQVNDFASLSGTSMATPQVAGASMLIRQAMSQDGTVPSAEEVLQRLREASATRIDAASGESYQIVDLQAAIAPAFAGDNDASDVGGGDSAATDERQPATLVGRFDGTQLADAVVLDFSEGVSDGAVLRFGGQTHRIHLSDRDAEFVLDVGDGSDSLVILGSPQAERLIAHPTTSGEASRLSTAHGEFVLRGFERIDFRGQGGPDRATLYDSRGNDTLHSHPGQAALGGVGFGFEVTTVPRIYVHATAGGDDAAFLHDSAGDDQLSVRPQFTSLRGEGAFQLAYGFERVYAYAQAGGNDAAELHDSAGDDTMSVSAGRAMISSEGYQVSTRGFQSVVGIASDSGHDTARLYADPGAHRWDATGELVQWTGEQGDTRIARGFERTLAFENYQPIDLSQHSLPSWLFPTRERAVAFRDEAEASRMVFERLGDSL